LDLPEERSEIHPQAIRGAVEKMKRRSPIASLDAAQMLYGDIEILRERRLRESKFTAEPMQISPDRR